MLLDQNFTFSKNDAQMRSASTYYSDVVDIGAYREYLRNGGDLWLVVAVGTAFAGAGNITVALQSDDNVGFASAATVWTTAATVYTTFTGGKVVTAINLGGIAGLTAVAALERFLRLAYTNSGTITAGTINAFVTTELLTNARRIS
jgi:hypothetical protein